MNWFYKISTAIIVILAFPFPGSSQIIDTACIGAERIQYGVMPTKGSVYHWFVEGGEILPPGNSPSVLINWGDSAGIFNLVVVEETKDGCFGDTVVAQVLIREKIVLEVFKPDIICRGKEITIKVVGAPRYKWSDGQFESEITIRPESSVNYKVIGFDDGCSNDTAEIRINVLQGPLADFSINPQNPELNTDINFTYKGTPVENYEWKFEEEDNRVNLKNPIFRYSSPGKKNVRLVVEDQFGCLDTVVREIFVDGKTYIYVPNAFSPNGDNHNDKFIVVGDNIREIKMEIFDRWGGKVTTIENRDAGWDGTMEGKPVQDGKYYWQLVVVGNNNQTYYLNGSVVLIR